MLLNGSVTNAIDPQWGVMAMDWDVSLRLALNIDVIAGTFIQGSVTSDHDVVLDVGYWLIVVIPKCDKCDKCDKYGKI